MEHSEIIASACAPLAFTCEPREIEAAAAFLAKRIAERRGSVPILATIHLAADPAGSVTLTATDLEQWASVAVAANVESPGAICIDAGALADALAKLRKGGAHEMRLADKGDGRATVNASGTRAAFTLNAMPADDFPLAPTVEIEGEASLSRFAVPAAQFFADLAALAPCISTKEHPYWLAGVAMQARELAGRERLCLVACDNANIAVASRPMPAGAEALDVIVPRDVVASIARAAKLAPGAEAVAITVMQRPLRAAIVRLSFGGVEITAKAIDAEYIEWPRLWGEGGGLAPTDGEAALFPELLPGAPAAMLEKIGKAAPGKIEWQPAINGLVGSVAGDPGLLFGAMALAGAGCGRKGFSYHDGHEAALRSYMLALAEAQGMPLPAEIEARCAAINDAWGEPGRDHYNGCAPHGRATANHAEMIYNGGRIVGLTIAGTHERYGWNESIPIPGTFEEQEIAHASAVEPVEGSHSVLLPADAPAPEYPSWIEAADGIRYPVADDGKAIHLSAAQVRELIGESCFETFAVTIGGKVHHVLQWLWDDGASRFLTVQANGRCYKSGGGIYLERAEIEAALAGDVTEAGDMPEIPASEAQEIVCAPYPHSDSPEPIEALSGPEIDAIGFFVIDTGASPEMAVSHHATYDEAKAARDALEPRATYPGNRKTDGKIWRYMVTAETGPNDCRGDLFALSQRYHADVLAGSGDAEPLSIAQELPADPVAALLARVEALEAALTALPAVSSGATKNAENYSENYSPAPTVERAKRSPAHERTIRRAWAERKARREAQSGERAAWFQANLMRDTAANNNRCAQHHIVVAERLREKRRRAVLNARATLSRLRTDLAEAGASNAEWEALQHRTWTEAMGHKAKRRRAVHRAINLRRAAGIERARAETLAAQLAKAKHDLDAQGRAATYFDAETGMEMADRTGRAVHEARRATERADALQARLDNAMAGNAAMQAGIDRMEGELVAAVIRARKAETALAAVQARANGWPPAVRSVSVRFDAKAA